MCLHYLVKLIARVLSPYITYFSIGLQVVHFSHQIFTNCWNNSFQQSTTVSVVFTDIYITHSLPVMLITFAVTVFSVLDSFSHMQPMWSVITHFVWNVLQTVTPNKITSANQHFLYVFVHYVTTFSHLMNCGT